MWKAALNLVLIVATLIERAAQFLADQRLINQGRKEVEGETTTKILDMEKQARAIEATNHDPAAARDWLRDSARDRARGTLFGDGPP